VLVRNLPPDSAYVRSLGPDGMSVAEGLSALNVDITAAVVETVHELIRVTLAAHGVKGGDLPPPLHMPRVSMPSYTPPKPKATPLAEAISIMEAW